MIPWAQTKVMDAIEIASRQYGMVEGAFKVIMLRDYIERWEKQQPQGRTFKSLSVGDRQAVITNAVAFANDAIFDYSAVPNWVKFVRKYPLGAPFITFTYKAFPAIIKNFMKHPQKFAKYAAMPMLASQMFLAMNPDLRPKDYEELLRRMPLWMRDHMSIYILPFKDANGKWVPLNLSSMNPLSVVTDPVLHAYNHFHANGFADVSQSTMSELLYAATDEFGFLGGPAPKAILGLLGNEDSFMHKEIVKEGDTPAMKFASMLKYTWEQAMPTWMTDNGAFAKLYHIANETDKNQYGTSKETAFEAVMDFAGAKTNPFDPKESNTSNLRNFARETKSIQDSLKAVMMNQNLSTADKVAKAREFKELMTAQKQRINNYQRGE
jgi:hypothetical protein